MTELGRGRTQQAVRRVAAPVPAPVLARIARAGRRLPPAVRVGLFTAALALAAAALYHAFLQDAPAPAQPRGVGLPWYVMAAAFFFAEMRVIDVHFRREKHSFSLSEFPAVVSFFLLSPTEYFAAMLLGTSAALLWTRHAPLKFAFNLANWAACTSAGLTVFYLLQVPDGPPDPWHWVAAFAATTTAAVISATSIATAITLSGGAPQFQKLPEMYQFGLLVAIANTSLALLAVAVLWHDPAQLALLIVPLVTVFLAYRAYQSEREKHERLDLLYQSSRILQHSPELDSAVGALLEHARQMFRAERAEILLWPREAGREGLLTTAMHDAPVVAMVATPLDAAHPLHLRAGRDLRPFLHLAPARDADGIRHAMVAPLAGEGGLLGSMVVANRLTEGTTFDADDLRLLETLANQATVALQNGQLEQSLGELSRLKEELRFQAYHDPLTGLANRSLFTESVDAALRERHDDRVPVVLFLDLDDFKDVNDTLGHATGDRLLVAVADRVRSCIREDDLAARLGGDEFAMLIHDDDRLGRALAVSRRVIDALAVSIPVPGQDLTVSASIGIAAGRAVSNADELLRNADVAMYTAKQSGKNAFSVFDPEMHSAIVARHALSTDLSRGIAAGEIVVWFQPIVNLATGAMYGAEALARWQHPTRGIVSPDEFIRLAEESGAILPLGRAVLFDACREVAQWPSDGPHGPVVSVNLSAAQLARDTFVAEVVDTLRGTGLPPTRLVLEMTETAMFHDTEVTISRLTELRRIGVRVAIDDFGTGYSSLGYLRRFPVDILKIAREFIADRDDGPDRWAFASAIVGLGRTLNLRVVAEGIETLGQRDGLASLGCELGQGFLYARPLPAPELRRRFGSMVIPAGARPPAGELQEASA